jgi:hypothetical protein
MKHFFKVLVVIRSK